MWPLLAALALAAAPKLAVLPVAAGEGIPPSTAAALTEALSGEVRRRAAAEVITQREIAAVLSLERQKEMLGCTSDGCMAELGGALGAEHLVAGSVARLGQGFVVNLQLINVAHASVENRSSVTWEGPEPGLVRVVGLAAQDLLLDRQEKLPGRVDVTQLPPGATLFLDARPKTAPLEKIDMGTHELKITAPDHDAKVVTFVLKSGEQLTIDGALQRHVEPVSDARPVALTAQFEICTFTDQLTVNGAKKTPAPVIALEGTYRFSRWVRLGVRGYKLVDTGRSIEATTPWASGTGVTNGGGFGLLAATSLLFKPGSYDFSVDAGADLHLEQLAIVSYTLPRTYSVAKGAPNEPGPRFGVHGGLSAEWFLSPTFSLGLVARYFWEAGYTITFNGQSIHRSLSSFVLAPRLTLLF